MTKKKKKGKKGKKNNDNCQQPDQKPLVENHEEKVVEKSKFRNVTIGDIVDGYELVRRIGEGGMGKVYEVHHERTERKAALKVLSLTEDMPEALRSALKSRFTNETQIMWRLSDAGVKFIPHIYHMPNDPPGIIMDLLEGIPLNRYLIEEMRGISEEELNIRKIELLKMLAKITDALAGAHSLDIIHRDLKAENIFIKNFESHRDFDPVLIDFGIAKNPKKKLTQMKLLMGTPSCMAPEQLIGKTSRISKKTDIFPIGMLIFNILSGEEFYEGLIDPELEGVEQCMAMLRVLLDKDEKGMDLHVIPKRLERIPVVARGPVRACLSWDQDERIPGMHDLKGALWTIIEELKITYLGGEPSQGYHTEVVSLDVSQMNISELINHPTVIDWTEDEDSIDDEKVPTSVLNKGSGQTPIPEEKNSFVGAVVLVTILCMFVVGIFALTKLRPDLFKHSGSSKRSRHKKAKKVKKPAMQVVMRPVMQPDGSMKVMKVVVMKPERAIKKPIIAKPIVVKPVVQNFQHFRKECSKIEWQAKDLDAMLKCIMLSLPKMTDVFRKYDSYNQTYMHYCHPALRRNLRAGRAICGNLENATLKVGYKVADAILKPIREKCMGEKPKYYGENPSSLRVCMRNYAKSINSHFAQAALVASRLHFVFCKGGPVHKRASVKSCFWARKDKVRLANRLWKQRDAAIRKRLAELKAAAKSK